MTPAARSLAEARHLSALGRFSEALTVVGPATVDPSTALEAECVSTQCLLGLGRVGDARGAVERALRAGPDSPEAHCLHALIELRQRHPKRAERAVQEALRLAPGWMPALHLLAGTQIALMKKRQAQATADRGVELHPQDPLAFLTAGIVATSRRNWPAAEAAFREGLSQDPDNSEMALRLGRVLQKAGRRDEAAQAYLAAGRADPTSHRSRNALAKVGAPLVIFGFLAKVAIYNAARVTVEYTHSPALTATLVLPGLLVVGAVWTALLLRGTRRLPPDVRAQLDAEHRNHGLRWVGATSAVSACLAVWAFARPHESGSGPLVGVLLAAIAVGLAVVVDRFWTGPFWRHFLPRFTRVFGRLPALIRR